MKAINFVWVLLVFAGLSACNQGSQEVRELKVYGPLEHDGEKKPYSTFTLTDQTGQPVSEQTVAGKVHVVDFFFTSCPTICPKMKQQMLRVHDKYMDEDQLLILSHSIDPRHDSVSVLKRYADKLDIQSHKWKLMTGAKDEVYELARQYMVSAAEDPNAPGGYVHSGAFILFDQQRRIRGFYDGTVPEEVDKLMADIEILLKS